MKRISLLFSKNKKPEFDSTSKSANVGDEPNNRSRASSSRHSRHRGSKRSSFSGIPQSTTTPAGGSHSTLSVHVDTIDNNHNNSNTNNNNNNTHNNHNNHNHNHNDNSHFQTLGISSEIGATVVLTGDDLTSDDNDEKSMHHMITLKNSKSDELASPNPKNNNNNKNKTSSSATNSTRTSIVSMSRMSKSRRDRRTSKTTRGRNESKIEKKMHPELMSNLIVSSQNGPSLSDDDSENDSNQNVNILNGGDNKNKNNKNKNNKKIGTNTNGMRSNSTSTHIVSLNKGDNGVVMDHPTISYADSNDISDNETHNHNHNRNHNSNDINGNKNGSKSGKSRRLMSDSIGAVILDDDDDGENINDSGLTYTHYNATLSPTSEGNDDDEDDDDNINDSVANSNNNSVENDINTIVIDTRNNKNNNNNNQITNKARHNRRRKKNSRNSRNNRNNNNDGNVLNTINETQRSENTEIQKSHLKMDSLDRTRIRIYRNQGGGGTGTGGSNNKQGQMLGAKHRNTMSLEGSTEILLESTTVPNNFERTPPPPLDANESDVEIEDVGDHEAPSATVFMSKESVEYDLKMRDIESHYASPNFNPNINPNDKPITHAQLRLQSSVQSESQTQVQVQTQSEIQNENVARSQTQSPNQKILSQQQQQQRQQQRKNYYNQYNRTPTMSQRGFDPVAKMPAGLKPIQTPAQTPSLTTTGISGVKIGYVNEENLWDDTDLDETPVSNVASIQGNFTTAVNFVNNSGNNDNSGIGGISGNSGNNSNNGSTRRLQFYTTPTVMYSTKSYNSQSNVLPPSQVEFKIKKCSTISLWFFFLFACEFDAF